MSSRFEVVDLENLEDSLLSWISKHLGERSSYISDGVSQLPSLYREDSRTSEGNPLTGEVNQSTTPPKEDPSSPGGNSLVAL